MRIEPLSNSLYGFVIKYSFPIGVNLTYFKITSKTLHRGYLGVMVDLFFLVLVMHKEISRENVLSSLKTCQDFLPRHFLILYLFTLAGK